MRRIGNQDQAGRDNIIALVRDLSLVRERMSALSTQDQAVLLEEGYVSIGQISALYCFLSTVVQEMKQQAVSPPEPKEEALDYELDQLARHNERTAASLLYEMSPGARSRSRSSGFEDFR